MDSPIRVQYLTNTVCRHAVFAHRRVSPFTVNVFLVTTTVRILEPLAEVSFRVHMDLTSVYRAVPGRFFFWVQGFLSKSPYRTFTKRKYSYQIGYKGFFPNLVIVCSLLRGNILIKHTIQPSKSWSRLVRVIILDDC